MHESYTIFQSRPKRGQLQVDPTGTSFRRRVDDEQLPDSAHSSPRSATLSPESPLTARSISTGALSDSGDIDASIPPASGPQRSRSSTVSSVKGEKEKRKRSRVTPDQLVHLERFFSVDRSPTANRRREISELLNMQERQTQIWFQNRRANPWNYVH
jgi:regulatory protein PHO2